ncbi:hypothetical protein HHK36_008036 [Tetracentron sinense]|uniref:Uncharacterized protein n=1 Tax=Tetracentron sinense TaxID=13715 RepID=A0A834ZFS9_TETSI|nr:hypothetical protein HHK36_008036 [Tetracentron sinense]
MADIAILVAEDYERMVKSYAKRNEGQDLDLVSCISVLARRLDGVSWLTKKIGEEKFEAAKRVLEPKSFEEIAVWLVDERPDDDKKNQLNKYNMSLKSSKCVRDSLYLRLSEGLVAKSKADDQLSWRVLQYEKLARLREKMHLTEKQLLQGKAKIEKMSNDLKVKYGLLDSAMSMLERNRVEQLEKFYPNLICTQSLGHMAITSERLHKQSVVMKQICKLFPQRRVDGERKDGSSGLYDQICNARLPRGLDPHSVPSDELAASLG